MQVVGRALELTTTAAAPTSVDGAEVVDVIDSVIVTQATPDGPRTDRIEVDRRTGEVRLAAVGAEPFVAVPGVTPWLVNPPPATAPDSPGTVTFDLEALNDAVGGPAFDRSTTLVSADRLLALDDGRILVAAGVAATLAWFDDGLGASAPAAVPVDAAAASSPRGLLMVVAVVLVALLAGGILARWVVLRRRARAEAAEPRPIERVDALGTESVWLDGPSSLGRRAAASGLPSPRTDPAHPPVDRSSPPVERVVVPPGPMPWPRTVGPVGTSVPPPTAPVVPAPPVASGSGESVSPVVDPLAAFLADVDALSARVDRLGGVASPADAGEPHVERGSVEQASR